MSFGERLRTLLEERDMTQKELATQLNIAPSTMGSYVQNTRQPDFATLKVLAQYFHVSTDYLLEHTPDKAVTPQEHDLLRMFRAMSTEHKAICLEQCRAFIKSK